ncbi:MAG: methyl-accepting chemotaxis protein, partial [Microcystaceae cyanobacterium]
MSNILQSKNLKTRILLGYGVPLGILALFGVSIGVVSQIINNASDRLTIANEVIDNVRDTVIHSSRMVRSLRGAVIFPTDPSYRESYSVGEERLDESLNKMTGLIRDEQQKANWDKLLKEVEDIRKSSDNVMALVQKGQLGQAKAGLADVRIAGFDKIKDAMIKRQGELLEEFGSQEHNSIVFLQALAVLGLFGGGAVSLYLGNMIAGAIAKDVKMAVAEVSAASNEIAATMEQQERTASLQAASVSETTTTMDELGASSQQSQEQAEAAAQAAQEVLVLAGRGNDSVEETVASMIDLKNKVAAIADQIVRLSEQTNQIGNISQLVGDLSQQTN